MSKNVVIVGAVILILVALGYFITRPKPAIPPALDTTTQVTPTESASPVASSEAMTAKNVVSITSTGFSSKDITVKVGDSITWENTDSADHTVNSAPHPTHTAYPPLNLGLIKPGEGKSLTFPTAGTYKYHDHLNPSLTGSVTVQ